jgi:purine-nucleoside/S-methyl-5'-thioadenosine phosphorylase / adenosine deaminase
MQLLQSNVPSKPQLESAAPLKKLPWLVHGFSTRHGGVSKVYGKGALNLGFTEADTKSAVTKNRTIFLQAIAAKDGRGNPWPLATLKQIHSAVIHHVTEAPKQPLKGDGIITDTPGLALAIQTADCLPVLLVDPVHRAVGAFHAGWRGTYARIVEKGVGMMRMAFGSNPKKLIAAIGPGVHVCCYEVGHDLQNQFREQFRYADELFEEVFDHKALHLKYPLLFLSARAPGHSDFGPQIHLDLVKANTRQLLDAGLQKKNIHASELCTVCRNDLLFSHRAEFGKTGRMMGAVGIRA